MPNFIELRGSLHILGDTIAWQGPTKHTPMPKTREEMAVQLNSVWAELRDAMLDRAFPPAPIAAGDDARGQHGDD